MKSGLNESSLLCENTFVPELLSGREAGRVLALDLGGTNFRVMGLELVGGRVAGETVQHYTVPEQVCSPLVLNCALRSAGAAGPRLRAVRLPRQLHPAVPGRATRAPDSAKHPTRLHILLPTKPEGTGQRYVCPFLTTLLYVYCYVQVFL